jgi:hypothetical protein
MAASTRNRNEREAAQYVVDELRRRGLCVKAGSRFELYASRFVKGVYSDTDGLRDQRRLTESLLALRDVREAEIILEECSDIGAQELMRLADDAILPRTDHSTPGRDRQFELFIGAIGRRGGMQVFFDKEPDLWCEAGRVWYAVAAKRLRSAAKFIDNVRDAAEQIQKSQLLHGIVFIDVTLGWNPEMATIYTRRSPGDVAFDLRERVSRNLDEHGMALASIYSRCPKVLGSMVIDLTFTHQAGPGWNMDQTNTFHPAHTADRSRKRLVSAFRAAFHRGLSIASDIDHRPRTGMFSGPPVDQIIPLRPKVE